MEITENNDHCKNCNCHLMSWEKATCRKFRQVYPIVLEKNRKSRFISLVANAAITARLFPFWKQSVVRKTEQLMMVFPKMEITTLMEFASC